MTPNIRTDIQEYIAYLGAQLKNARHVSGDDCEHCGMRHEIAYLTECLAGDTLPYDDDMARELAADTREHVEREEN